MANEEARLFIEKQVIDREIEILAEILHDAALVKSLKSNNTFWRQNAMKMPNLRKLYTILSNVCASSAYVERFFSITGFIADRRRLKMTPYFFITRCMLKTNMHLLNELEVK